ncbi:hypothetical protein Sjap_019300 [Stephania japonica]|uniref:Uncharacterized protein n=1 Tax=Stephania japonica TaxID=461633 RepID=A0AAP0HZ79_9MAGN
MMGKKAGYTPEKSPNKGRTTLKGRLKKQLYLDNWTKNTDLTFKKMLTEG